jgi:hypothetical protein
MNDDKQAGYDKHNQMSAERDAQYHSRAERIQQQDKARMENYQPPEQGMSK